MGKAMETIGKLQNIHKTKLLNDAREHVLEFLRYLKFRNLKMCFRDVCARLDPILMKPVFWRISEIIIHIDMFPKVFN